MGMGEPLLNLPAVIPAVRYLQDTLGISGRNITISTVGVPNALRKLAEAQLTATLAVSIHAPNQVGVHPHFHQPVQTNLAMHALDVPSEFCISLS